MNSRLKRPLVVVAIGALTVAGVAIATPARNAIPGFESGEAETPITGPALTRASAAALGAVGGGRVTETEVGDEEGFYEVEVRRADGSQVDVHLDENFNVLGRSADEDHSGDSDGAQDR